MNKDVLIASPADAHTDCQYREYLWPDDASHVRASKARRMKNKPMG